jgi:hypothetical protein
MTITTTIDIVDDEPIRRLTKDLRDAAATLSAAEARYLVDGYYQMQRDRIRSDHQVRQLASGQPPEPHTLLVWFGGETERCERVLRSALGHYARAHAEGRWAQSIVGIGPVISAGLLAHIDINRAPTVGHIWRFAGLDPTVTWDRNQKRPWNGALKRLCWLIGESFTRVQHREGDIYGKLYAQRKAIEEEKNAAGAFAEQAARSLASKDWRRDTATKAHYQAGHLPPARVHLRAQRWAVKIFLAHFHHVAHETHFGTPPPKPYVLEHVPGHVHAIEIPNWPL